MKVVITGGAGFIGINAASFYLGKNDDVVIFDNFSRKGTRANIEWLKKNSTKDFQVIEGSVEKDNLKMEKLFKDAQLVLHLAGQVAVTTSVENPLQDFVANALGTLNVLEAIRACSNQPVLIYSSTNKVYGSLDDIQIIERKTRYAFKDLPFGVSEKQQLDFHSPYGCSKGAADQYVHDYARIYDLKTIVFRQSCIYGPRQFGVEDQGWLAWFMIALTRSKKITIYGDGKQTRDVLHVNDLLNAYDSSYKKITKTKGQIYNIGGGQKNSISVWTEFGPMLEKLSGKSILVSHVKPRPGDQKIFISDIKKAKNDFDWEPKINVSEGISELYQWINQNKNFFV